LKAHSVLLFDLQDQDLLTLNSDIPETVFNDLLEFNIPEYPLLEKAVRFKEPIFINRPDSENVFISYLNSVLQIHISAICIYPIIINDETKFVLTILKANWETFTNEQFSIIEFFSELFRFKNHFSKTEIGQKDPVDKQDKVFYYTSLEKIVNQLGFGILAIDNKNQIKFLNEKAAQIFRVSPQEVIYKPLTNLLNQNEIEIMLSFKDSNIDTIERPELKIEVGEKEKILLGFSVYQYSFGEMGDDGYILSLKDITVRKEMEDEQNRIENINSMGLMTTGIAHEIRNPLAGVKAIAQTLLDELDEQDSHREHLSRIIRLVNRLDDLLKSLYAFARPAKPKRDFTSIEKILRNVTNSLQKKIKDKNIQMIETFHSNLPDIFVDNEQINIVLSNILTNSIEAIESDGEIKISAQAMENGNPLSNEHFKSLIQGKSYVKIHIHDNGCGISQSNLKNIFNPFFTTKMLSAGLGLSVAYQTVKQNGGLIYLESEVHKGTDCFIILPAYN
jgi:nitrogen-specific signal transduction histidine kinase